MSEGLSGQAFCRVCKTPCGRCGCRLGGCFTEAWWAEQRQQEADWIQLPDGAATVTWGQAESGRWRLASVLVSDEAATP